MGNFAKNLILSHENNPQVKRPECARRLMYTAVAKKSPPIENIKEHLPSCKTEGSSSAQTKARGGIMGPIGMGDILPHEYRSCAEGAVTKCSGEIHTNTVEVGKAEPIQHEAAQAVTGSALTGRTGDVFYGDSGDNQQSTEVRFQDLT
ncbi:hypothetical protein F444_01242 [Phytophthora nicotianae P1976]|uniref:Uncharacterized protein n=1 Tax=Phytophthora nicotianae P1976 TaxID=1317066 RepID=A0A081B198_PHYNI|nr:hypothetical protein F444_01242 [Phytophthora nicotianae P1976]